MSSDKSIADGTEILLVRHGETEWNVQGRVQGSGDSPLTAKGIAQAEALAFRLWRSGERPIAACYASDLGRAQETARIILAGRVSTELAMPVHTAPRLAERKFGVLEGLTTEEKRARYPEVLEAMEAAADDSWAPPGGESRAEVRERAMAELAAIAGRHPRERVLVVTHGAVVANVGRSVLGLERDAGSSRLSTKNAALHLIRWANGRWSVDLWGDAGEFCAGSRPGYFIVDTAAAVRLLGVGAMAGTLLGLGIGALLARARSRR